jgi:hypothetical protein
VKTLKNPGLLGYKNIEKTAYLFHGSGRRMKMKCKAVINLTTVKELSRYSSKPFPTKESAMKQLSFVFSPAATSRRADKRDTLRSFAQEQEVDCVVEATPNGGTRRKKLPSFKAQAAIRYAGTGLVYGL